MCAPIDEEEGSSCDAEEWSGIRSRRHRPNPQLSGAANLAVRVGVAGDSAPSGLRPGVAQLAVLGPVRTGGLHRTLVALLALGL
jgi:hypothetical protein